MRSSVAEVFFDFTADREGFTPFMYADTLNLVTTGVGNLIDAGPNHDGESSAERASLNTVVSAAAMQPAMTLPWKLRAPGWTSKNPLAGERVSPSEIADAWTAVKTQNERSPGFAQGGGGHYAGLTNITLDLEGIESLFQRTLRNFETTLRSRYPEWDSWPADAQLAVLSMAWAMGPAFNFPAFKAAMDRRDFAGAIPHSFFRGGGGTQDAPAGRNLENQIMLQNADVVERTGADPDRLIFPGASGGGRLPSGVRISGRSLMIGALVASAAAVGFQAWRRPAFRRRLFS